MCFSPEASFTSGFILSAVGIAALKKIQVPSQTAFASIPLVFGVQQIAEGFVWMSFADPAFAFAQNAGMYTFLFVARVLWPVLMPFAVLRMEKEGGQMSENRGRKSESRVRKRILQILIGMGSVVAVYYSYCLLFLNVAPNISGHHVQYISDFPESLAVPVFFIYAIAGIAPMFVSSIQRMRAFGVLMFVSCLITGVFYLEFLTSVWCFFAAVISVMILWIVSRSKS